MVTPSFAFWPGLAPGLRLSRSYALVCTRYFCGIHLCKAIFLASTASAFQKLNIPPCNALEEAIHLFVELSRNNAEGIPKHIGYYHKARDWEENAPEDGQQLERPLLLLNYRCRGGQDLPQLQIVIDTELCFSKASRHWKRLIRVRCANRPELWALALDGVVLVGVIKRLIHDRYLSRDWAASMKHPTPL